jgi:hypothetical protein
MRLILIDEPPLLLLEFSNVSEVLTLFLTRFNFVRSLPGATLSRAFFSSSVPLLIFNPKSVELIDGANLC